MGVQDLLFYFLGGLSLFGALGVVLAANPIYASLFLVLSMVSISGIFFSLGAYFVAGVQLLVYAGAVMVLFVMVIMIFDLKKELSPYSDGFLRNILKFRIPLPLQNWIKKNSVGDFSEKTYENDVAISSR